MSCVYARDHSCTSVERSAHIRAINRLENQRAFVMMAVDGAEKGIGDGTITGFPDEAFAVAARSCVRSCTV